MISEWRGAGDIYGGVGKRTGILGGYFGQGFCMFLGENEGENDEGEMGGGSRSSK